MLQYWHLKHKDTENVGCPVAMLTKPACTIANGFKLSLMVLVMPLLTTWEQPVVSAGIYCRVEDNKVFESNINKSLQSSTCLLFTISCKSFFSRPILTWKLHSVGGCGDWTLNKCSCSKVRLIRSPPLEWVAEMFSQNTLYFWETGNCRKLWS